jgi:hypothetical protein
MINDQYMIELLLFIVFEALFCLDCVYFMRETRFFYSLQILMFLARFICFGMLLKRPFDVTTSEMIIISTVMICTCPWCVIWSEMLYKLCKNSVTETNKKFSLFVKDFMLFLVVVIFFEKLFP